ncbi:MAG: hypothetical protein J1E16_02140 [Muribaculaceae bacterium]|nr:hypothetical protein [Muribaculaceae bacterium]
MKIKSLSGMCAALVALSACTQETFNYEAPNFTSADLTEGKAYTVSVNPETNEVTLQSLLGDQYVTSWVTPNGMAKGLSYTFSLPFSGTYEVTFGVDTRGGLVYGEPYSFTISNNNFSLLSDEIWTNLAGGVDENGNGNPKTWVPMNQKYGSYHGSAPVTYMSPNDVKNDGSGSTDIKIGTSNWSDNWDPGFQSWLIDSDDPYMDSEMTFYLDAQKGSVAEIKRVTADGTQEYTTTFNLNVSDPQRPLISMNSGEILHAAWGDGVCDNYSTEIKIIECTPYVFQFATMRTNSEGPWWIVWNFVSKELKEDPSILPSEGPELVEVASPKLPTYDNLLELLFTIEGDGVTYTTTSNTFLMNEEKPYDVMAWNGANGGSWDWINGYGSSWAPAYPSYDEFSLNLAKKYEDLDGDDIAESLYYLATVENSEGTSSSRFTLGENSIIFNEPLTFMKAGNQIIESNELTVIKVAPGDDEVILGVPDGYNEEGEVNRYLCLNLTIKPVGSGQEGPKNLAVNVDNINCWLDAGSGQIRIVLYQPASWGGGDPALDTDQLVLKKEQSLSVTFKLNNIDWKDDAEPRAFLGVNMEGYGSWSFDSPESVKINKGGETTVSITNTTPSKYSFFGNDCVQVAIEQDGLINGPFDEEGNIDAANIGYEIVSVIIQ